MAQILGYLENGTFDEIANAIREKNGETAKYTPSTIPSKIRALNIGYDTTDATATSDDILLGKTAYVSTGKVNGGLTVVNCYDGSSEPSASIGVIGDLYIMVDSEISTEDMVGTLDDENTFDITLSDSLGSGTYTLYYEDDTNNKLDGWGEIATITK